MAAPESTLAPSRTVPLPAPSRFPAAPQVTAPQVSAAEAGEVAMQEGEACCGVGKHSAWPPPQN